MNINQLKFDHDIKRPYRAPSIEALEAEAKEKGQARFADVAVSLRSSSFDRHRDLFTYSVCGNEVSRSMASRAFA